MAAPSTPRARILCVDDEQGVLDGLKLNLDRRYELHTALSGDAGLRTLHAHGPFDVVLSDMRMPGMNGADFLAQVRAQAPNTVRMLLTGHADMDSAARAINEGQIFRFLTKPCPPLQLIQAMESGIGYRRLVTAEKELLEKTLLGSVSVLAEVLGLVQPEAFGRASRIKQYACEIADAAQAGKRWELETAAILSQIGSVTVAGETLAKAYKGQPLADAEVKALANVPALSIQLVAHIPRLEGVREILELTARPRQPAPETTDARACAEMLRIATEFDRLEVRGLLPDQAIEAMKAAGAAYDPALLALFATARTLGGAHESVRQLPVDMLVEGMILAEDLYTNEGVLFAAHGYHVTPTFVARARNSKASLSSSVVRCIVPAREDGEIAA